MQRPSRAPASTILRLGAAGAVTLALAAVLAGSAPMTEAHAQARQCFRAQDWMGTSAGGPRDLYVRVGMKDVWHVALAEDCPGAQYPGPVSVDDVVTGSNEICAAADMQIRVAPMGFSHATACIVSNIRKLTPEEIKALPRRVVP